MSSAPAPRPAARLLRHLAQGLLLAPTLSLGMSAMPRAALAPVIAQDERPESLEHEGTWVNFIGASPTPRSLKGRAVVLLFFGPGSMSGVNWGQIKAMYEEWDGKVTFLGVFSGTADQAQRLAEDNNLFFPIGIDTPFREHYAIQQASYQMLIDRDGGVYWHGPLGGLWEAKLQKGSRGASNAFEERMLFLYPQREYKGRLDRIAKKMKEGKLDAAFVALADLREDARAEPEDRAGGLELSRLLEAHVELLSEQIETQIGLREALRAQNALETIEKELRKTPYGARFKERLKELEDDEDFQRELAADKDFADLYKKYWTRAPSKWRKPITFFIEKHAGTRAARKARILSVS